MKVQLDTTRKTIKVEESANLGEFFTFLEQILPGEIWKEYTLEVGTVIYQWSNPIVIEKYPNYVPAYPSYPWITYTTDGLNTGGKVNINPGTYSIDCSTK